METEQLKIFDDNRKEIGIASRSDVHKFGYWHEVFHCWFVSTENEVNYIYLQLRSANKKDYPNLYDITAAGHLLADETVKDGVREIEEELGISVAYDELFPLGTIDYCVIRKDFIDKEIANVFLHKFNMKMDDFTLQKEEVAGMVRAEFTDFEALWNGGKDTIEISGFVLDQAGEKVIKEDRIGREHFVPHQSSFYQAVIGKIKEIV
ncbi:NUDIX hydrolase [Gracilibacillus oryzae]|uniref:NUDIX hydrolase n=1 Tax=Gracilibacillus oryzae TaxID=1672701 RepID=A0A7C8KVA2_9BACI|nr:NUDIX domain-containing protein [Gracilibacillus oryzae]KAB8138127.1 NUDIX hydrolase [Gracilibacillus oryzae]